MGLQLMNIAPGQQLYYFGARVWPDSVRKSMYDEYGGVPKDLMPAHDYDPKVLSAAFLSFRSVHRSTFATRTSAREFVTDGAMRGKSFLLFDFGGLFVRPAMLPPGVVEGRGRFVSWGSFFVFLHVCVIDSEHGRSSTCRTLRSTGCRAAWIRRTTVRRASEGVGFQ